MDKASRATGKDGMALANEWRVTPPFSIFVNGFSRICELAAMIRFLLSIILTFYCCVATASFEGKCIVSGQISSPVEEGFFPANDRQMKFICFLLKLESTKGLETEMDKWCSRVFKDRKDKKGNVTVRINNPSSDTMIPEVGGHGAYLWSYFESEIVLEGFSPYTPPAKDAEGSSDCDG